VTGRIVPERLLVDHAADLVHGADGQRLLVRIHSHREHAHFSLIGAVMRARRAGNHAFGERTRSYLSHACRPGRRGGRALEKSRRGGQGVRESPRVTRYPLPKTGRRQGYAWAYDGYVHGAYATAMEIYHGGRHEFMLRGHEDEVHRANYRLAVTLKLHEVLTALRIVAFVEKNEELSVELRKALSPLEDSPEYASRRSSPSADGGSDTQLDAS